MKVEVAVIGGGPGGYATALTAARAGATVALIEKDKLGGTCLHRGCIPTKALLRSAEVYRLVQGAEGFGVRVGGVEVDWKTAQARKDAVVARLARGLEALLRQAQVRVVKGKARFLSPHRLEVEGEGEIEAGFVVIATGSSPARLPVPGVDSPQVMGSDEALTLPELPRSLVVVGGGAIGVEFATLYRSFGVDVALVEMLPRLIPSMDHELGEALKRALSKWGIAVHTDSRVEGIEPEAGGECLVLIRGPRGGQRLKAQKVLLAVGRRPNVEGLNLEAAGVDYGKGGIPTDDRMQTNVPHIYAVGDVVGGPMLAHVAMRQGIVAAENILGGEARMDYRAIPQCVFSYPEVAGVGLTQEEAEGQGMSLRVGRFPFLASGKALCLGEREGFVKVVAEAEKGRVLGLHIIGPQASELLLEGTLAVKLGLTAEEVGAAIHAHPTLGEAIAEAALAAVGRGLHSLK